MNNSILSMNLLGKSVLSEDLSYSEKYTSEDVISGSCNGVEFKKITHRSELASIARISDQVGRSRLTEVPAPVAIQVGRMSLTGVSNSVAIDESEDEELFGDEADGVNKEIEVDNIKQDASIEKQDASIEKQDANIKKEKVFVQTNDVILEENRRKSNVFLLKNRKVSQEKTNRVRDNLVGDLAILFESKNVGSMLKINALAEGYAHVAEGIFDRSGLQSIDRECIDQAALRAMALRVNARGKEDFTAEDAGKAAKKATKLLRPDMKDKQGKAINDAQFYLIQEEIKKEFCLHIMSLGLIEKNEIKSTKKEESSQKKMLNNKEVPIQPERAKNTINDTGKIDESGLKEDLKRGEKEIVEGWNRVDIKRDSEGKFKEEKIIENLKKQREIEKVEIDKEQRAEPYTQ